MTKLCVAIFVTDPAKAQRDIAAAAEAGADMVELRIDHLTDAQSAELIARQSTLPCIITCRPVWEGGQSTLDDQQRLQLLAAAAREHATYVDIELQTALRLEGTALLPSPRERRTGLILSSHDFVGRPARLSNILADLAASPADIAKIVWTARTVRDNLEAFEILQHRQKPTIALCMGEAGLISRVLAKKFGAFLTFAALDKSAGTASGQIAIEDMKKLYRWDALAETTKVFGVVGSPIAHSMSPAIHNAAFDAAAFDGIYLPLLVEPGYESFKAFMETFLHFPNLDLTGLSVTIPHKENALRYLQQKNADVEPLAASIGAVNTIIVDRTSGAPRLRGINTDYAAILDSITAKLNISRDALRDCPVGVIGAGGAGRAAVAALAHCGARVSIYNRTLDRAQALAREFSGHTGPVAAAPLNDLAHADCRIYINASSVGMHPNTAQSPIDDHAPKLSPQTLVFDTIYNPMRTKLLTQAEQAGAPTISGVEMFLRQAAAQFQAWTSLPAPLAIMRNVIERRLAGA